MAQRRLVRSFWLGRRKRDLSGRVPMHRCAQVAREWRLALEIWRRIHRPTAVHMACLPGSTLPRMPATSWVAVGTPMDWYLLATCVCVQATTPALVAVSRIRQLSSQRHSDSLCLRTLKCITQVQGQTSATTSLLRRSSRRWNRFFQHTGGATSTRGPISLPLRVRQQASALTLLPSAVR